MTIQKITAPTKAATMSSFSSRRYFSMINVIKYTTEATEAVKKGLFLFMIPMIIIELLWQIFFPKFDFTYPLAIEAKF